MESKEKIIKEKKSFWKDKKNVAIVILAILLFFSGGSGENSNVTNTGSKYHRAGCRYLSKSQNPMSKEDAISNGYSACSVCKP